MIICPACQTANRPDAGFCSDCGAALPAAAEPVAGPDPLPAGAVVAQRFVITALLAQDPGSRTYAAADPATCRQCGAAVEPADRFCAGCGLDLAEPAPVRLRETAQPPDPPATAFAAAGRWYQVLPAASPAAQPGWRLQVGQASHVGQVRSVDEDSVLSLVLSGIYPGQRPQAAGLFVVADGMGGRQGGDVASRLAVQTIAQQVVQGVLWPLLRDEALPADAAQEQLEQAVRAANRLIHDLRRERGNEMGTTLTLALVIDGLALVGNVGDSRTYVWGPHGLAQLTRDHSLVADLVAAGQEPPAAVYTHPQRHLIYRSLGDQPQAPLDLLALELEPGYRLILCCDGVWQMIRDEGIEEIMLQEEHPQAAADKMVEWSNRAGGEDNISVIVVAVERA